MKPSPFVRQFGIKGLSEMGRLTGESEQTLNNWYKNNNKRFMLILKGLLYDQQFNAMQSLNDAMQQCQESENNDKL